VPPWLGALAFYASSSDDRVRWAASHEIPEYGLTPIPTVRRRQRIPRVERTRAKDPLLRAPLLQALSDTLFVISACHGSLELSRRVRANQGSPSHNAPRRAPLSGKPGCLPPFVIGLGFGFNTYPSVQLSLLFTPPLQALLRECQRLYSAPTCASP